MKITLQKRILKFLGQDEEKGLLAVFDRQQGLLDAACKMRELKIKKMEAFTPFPVHGLDSAMGLKRSWIPWSTLCYGLAGAGLLFFFQYWTHAVDWPLIIGGKPYFSWPAYIPITFEGMVLLGGVLTTITLFGTLKLPNFFKKVLDERLTDDHFGLFIDERDAHFDAGKLTGILKESGAKEIKQIG